MNRPDSFGAQDNSTTQSETSHAVTGRAVLAAWNDARQVAKLGVEGYNSLVGWRYSTDGGKSFRGGGFLQAPDSNCLGDPAIVADSSGYFYLAALASSGVGSRKLKNLMVARSTGNKPPFRFGSPVILTSVEPTGRLDKELMAIDRTGGQYHDRIYLSATDIEADRIVVAHTASLSPLSFSPLKFISPTGVKVDGSMPAVGPGGAVYVAWITEGSELQIVRSTNGGTTFANPDTTDPAPVKTITTLKAITSLSSPSGTITAESFPQIAVDPTLRGSPTRGHVYIVFAADPDDVGPDLADVFFTYSSNGGATWTAPRSISSGPAVTRGRDRTTHDNWLPAIAVSPVNGHIHVTFHDRRGDPANTRARLVRALSTDGGLSWSNAPLGTAEFVPIPGFLQIGASNLYWSEYNWATGDWRGMHFTWGDSRGRCAPPGAGESPCGPAGRPDPDAHYRRVHHLLGPDLFIQPWGEVTGLGPAWQTPDLFLTDAGGEPTRAGAVHRLSARVRNLGAAPARRARVRFHYAPWPAGSELPADSLAWQEIGSVLLDLSPAGSGRDTEVVSLDWEPPGEPGGADFAVQVSLELPGDIHLSNNVARGRFTFGAPAALLEPALGPATAEHWRGKPPPRPRAVPSGPGFERPLPPPWVVPEAVIHRRLYQRPSMEVLRAMTAMLAAQQEGPSVTNRERGLVNSRGVRRPEEEIRRLIVEEEAAEALGDGYSILSFYLEPRGETVTLVGAAALIAVDEGADSPVGLRLQSNGVLETGYLEGLAAWLGEVR